MYNDKSIGLRLSSAPRLPAMGCPANGSRNGGFPHYAFHTVNHNTPCLKAALSSVGTQIREL
jgi:hypothetical protein